MILNGLRIPQDWEEEELATVNELLAVVACKSHGPLLLRVEAFEELRRTVVWRRKTYDRWFCRQPGCEEEWKFHNLWMQHLEEYDPLEEEYWSYVSWEQGYLEEQHTFYSSLKLNK